MPAPLNVQQIALYMSKRRAGSRQEVAAEAGLPLIGTLAQPAQQRIAVIAGEGLQLIQQQLFPRTAQALVSGCCRAERELSALPP